jgi:hypothetical protein
LVVVLALYRSCWNEGAVAGKRREEAVVAGEGKGLFGGCLGKEHATGEIREAAALLLQPLA